MSTKSMVTRTYADAEERTPAYQAAVDALQRLEEEGGNTLAAYAEAVHESRERGFAETTGMRRATGHPCGVRLAGAGRCAQTPGSRPGAPGWCRPPAADHAAMWLLQGKPACITAEMYDVAWATLAATVDYCRAHGLEADINAGRSWRYPGWTTTVRYTRAGVEVPGRYATAADPQEAAQARANVAERKLLERLHKSPC